MSSDGQIPTPADERHRQLMSAGDVIRLIGASVLRRTGLVRRETEAQVAAT